MIRTLVAVLVSGLTCCLSVSAQQEPKPDPKPAPQAEQKPAEEARPKEEAPPRLELGRTLPVPVLLKDIDGNTHDAASYLGQLVVVNFWSTECPIMRGFEARLKAIQTEYAEHGVRFLMIDSNEGNGELDGKEPEEGKKPYPKLRSYLEDRELPYTVLVDHGSKVARLFDAKTTPDIFVFDREGKLVYRGVIDDDPKGNKEETRTNHLRNVLDKLLAGESFEPYATTPFGCSIKFPKSEGAQRGEGRGRSRGAGRRPEGGTRQ